jgi:hypothetical protein
MAAKTKPAQPTAIPPEGGDRAGDKGPPPKFGVGKPAAEGGLLPRVVDPLERAIDGTQRFKVACRNYSPRKVRYVLAKDGDEAGATACYLAAEGLDKELALLKELAGPDASRVEKPALVITPLND